MITRRGLIGMALGGGLGLPALARLSPALSANGGGTDLTGSIHSDQMVEFLSIQAQVNRSNPVWSRDNWHQLLGQLGIRYIRSNLASKRARDHMASLHGDFGIRACGMVTSINSDGSFNLAKTREILDFMRDEIGTEKIRAIEGPNEYTRRFKQPGWAERLAEYQGFVFDVCRSDAMLRHLPVLAPTIWRRVEDDYREISILGDYCDYGNLHFYSGGRRPSRYGHDGRDENLDMAIEQAQLVTPDRAICVTETGFSLAQGDASSSTVPEDVAARYTVRNVAEFFVRRARIGWMNIYTLMDYSEDSDYGMVDLDLVPRKSFEALRNFIAILSDPGAAPADAAGFACRLHTSSPDVRHILLHKRDGRRLVVLWRDIDSFDRRNRRTLENGYEPVRLDFGDHVIGDVLVRVPTVSDSPLKEYRSITNLELDVPDDVLVVEIAP